MLFAKNHLPIIDLSNLPNNLIIILYDKIPFSVTDAIVKNSSSAIPIMVTGDVSMTLAIEYQKPFFYEVKKWKYQHLEDLQVDLSKVHILRTSKEVYLEEITGLYDGRIIDGHIVLRDGTGVARG